MTSRLSHPFDKHAERELGHLVHAWLDGTTERLSDRLKDDVIARTADLPQHTSRWPALDRVRGRHRPLPTPGLTPIAAVVATVAAIALFALFAVFAFSGGIFPPTETEPAAVPSSPPATDATDEPQADATTVPVDPGPSPVPTLRLSGRDIVVALDGSGDVTTISEAIERADAGDRILVKPGTHEAGFVIDKDIVIEGDGPRDQIILRPLEHGKLPGPAESPEESSLLPAKYGVLLDATRAELRNLTFAWTFDQDVKVIASGGAPRLENVMIDPEQTNRLRLVFTNGTSATVVDSHIGSRTAIEAGATPLIATSEITNTMTIMGAGTAPVISGNRFRIGPDAQWESPGIAVALGAEPLIVGNDITAGPRGTNRPRTAIGIELAHPTVRDNTIRDSGTAISVQAASPVIMDNTLTTNGTGVAITCGTPQLEGNRIESNDIGLDLGSNCDVISDEGTVSEIRVGANHISGNARDVLWRDTAIPPSTVGRCLDASCRDAYVTETVEPGVVRVLDDGAGHDLRSIGSATGLTAARIGAVPGGVGALSHIDGILEVGSRGILEVPYGGGFRRPVLYEPDMTTWTRAVREFLAYRDGHWTMYTGPADGSTVAMFHARPEGGVDLGWAHDGRIVLYEVGPGSPDIARSDVEPLPIEGEGTAEGTRTPDGSVWLLESRIWYSAQERKPNRLWRHDGTTWQEVHPLGDGVRAEPGWLSVGIDGSLWVHLTETPPGPAGSVSNERLDIAAYYDAKYDAAYVARLKPDGSWATWSSADGSIPSGDQPALVATRDAVWMAPGREGCRGFARFSDDGVKRYLDGICVRRASVAGEGSVWVTGGRSQYSESDVGLYLITP